MDSLTLEAIFSSIESHGFSAAVNVASGYNVFIGAMERTAEVKTLASCVVRDESIRLATMERLKALTGSWVDPQFENPGDAAMAAYLWVLRGTEFSSPAAELVVACPNCWWARHVAMREG